MNYDHIKILMVKQQDKTSKEAKQYESKDVDPSKVSQKYESKDMKPSKVNQK